MKDTIQKDIEKKIQRSNKILEASNSSATFTVEEFFKIITPSMERVFKETIKNCNWEKIDKEICVNDFFMLHRNGRVVHDVKIYYERVDSPYFGKVMKLRNRELKKFIKLVEENNFENWRNFYE